MPLKRCLYTPVSSSSSLALFFFFSFFLVLRWMSVEIFISWFLSLLVLMFLLFCNYFVLFFLRNCFLSLVLPHLLLQLLWKPLFKIMLVAAVAFATEIFGFLSFLLLNCKIFIFNFYSYFFLFKYFKFFLFIFCMLFLCLIFF